jgi:hypothetical protein
MVLKALPRFLHDHYEIHEWKHASAVLQTDFPDEWADIIEVLRAFRLNRTAITAPGGGKSDVSNEIDQQFTERGWIEKAFDTKVVIDATALESPTHKIDCYKNRVALEIEWNNKDPFFDRDLNNFRLLFELRAISVGVIITRCDELQELFVSLGIGRKCGASTTHMSKLLPRLEGGSGGGCPVLVFGITKKLYVKD